VIVVWEVVGLKGKLSELLAASLKAVSEHSYVTYRPGPLYSEPKLTWAGRGVGVLAKLRKATITFVMSVRCPPA